MPFEFKKTEINGPIVIEPRYFGDDRGFFAETYKKSDFVKNGIPFEFSQDNHSCSSKGVLRGLHYQTEPSAQGKLVRVIRGKVWDVAVDIRKSSSTFGKWVGVELSEENRKMFFIPPGFAHGFLTLEDDTHFVYKCTNEYDSACDRSIRWDDIELAVKWPLELLDGEPAISKKDSDAILLKDAEVFK